MRGNVSNSTRLHCDVRHKDVERTKAMEADLRQAIKVLLLGGACGSTLTLMRVFHPVTFDPTLCALLRSKAHARQFSTRDMIAAAGHDRC